MRFHFESINVLSESISKTKIKKGKQQQNVICKTEIGGKPYNSLHNHTERGHDWYHKIHSKKKIVKSCVRK